MKKIIKKIGITLGVLLFVINATSCLDGDAIDFGKGPLLVQFEKFTTDLNLIQDAENTPVEYEFTVGYEGADGTALNEDVQVTIITSSTSDAKEGIDFEIITKNLTIPSGQKSTTGSLKVFPGGLVPFVFKDIVLEISDASISLSEKKTSSITLKALGPNTLAGTYDVDFGGYYRQAENDQIGTFGGTVSIEAIAPGLYKHIGIAFWPENNDFYFTVDDTTGVITIMDSDPAGIPTSLNTSPIMTCDDTFNVVVCDDTTNISILKSDGKHVIKLTTGYFRDISANGTREFYEELIRQ